MQSLCLRGWLWLCLYVRDVVCYGMGRALVGRYLCVRAEVWGTVFVRSCVVAVWMQMQL
jgi:hypothetical protein